MPDSEQIKSLKTAIAEALKEPFGGVIEVLPDGGDGFFIDGRAKPPAVRNKLPKGVKADCTWRGAGDVLMRVFGGERALESAYVSGRLRISGDMSVMARLSLEGTR